MGNDVIVEDHPSTQQISESITMVLRLQEIKKYQTGLISNGITSIQNFMKICSAVFKLLHVYGQMDGQSELNRHYTGL
jgi:hypothetical protein